MEYTLGLWEVVGWGFFVYAVGTAFGWYKGMNWSVELIAEKVIDGLIKDGYLKTKGKGKDLEILKHWETDD